MKRVSRRSFFEWFAPRPAPASAARSAGEPPSVAFALPVLAPLASPVAREPEPSSTTTASGFSLEAFYAARGPQKLPPIAIRPSVLHHARELTHVGCPPPHNPPSLEGDPLYARLAAANAGPSSDDDRRS
jgi:hypothetical protein